MALFSEMTLWGGKPLLLCVICSGLLSLARFNTIPVGSFFDDAHYIVLAEGLASGRGYHLVNFPHAPVETAFPPGWPLMVAPLVALFPHTVIPLKLLVLVLWLASIPLVYKLFTTRLRPPYPLLLSVLVASNATLIGMAGTVMSEAAYLFFSMLTLYLFERWNQRGAPRRTGILLAILALALFTVAIRTIGIALLAGLLVYLLRRLRWQQVMAVAAVLLLGTVPLAWFNAQRGGTFLFSPLYQTHVAYVSTHVGHFMQIWEHVGVIPYRMMATALVPMVDFAKMSTQFASLFNGLFSAGVLLLVIWGFALALRHCRATELYVLFYTAILYAWIVYTGTLRVRLLIPLIPFGYFYLLHALAWCTQRWPPGNRRVASLTVSGFLCAVLVLNLGGNVYAWLNPTRERVPDLSAGTTWVRQHAPADAVLMTVNPVPDYLYAQRWTVGYPTTADVNLADYIAERSVGYVLVRPNLNYWDNVQRQLDPYVADHLLPYLRAHPRQFEQVYHNPEENVLVYQVIAQEAHPNVHVLP